MTCWDERHGASDVEWLCEYGTLRPLLHQAVQALAAENDNLNPAVLLLGCSTPSFPQDLYHDGLKDIVCLEASAVAARKLQQLVATHGALSGVQVVHASAQEPGLGLGAGAGDGKQFDIVVDKALLDCMMTSPSGTHDATAVLDNIYGRMRTPSVWISVSHSPPDARMDLYNKWGARHWHDVKVKVVNKGPLEAALESAVLKEALEEYDASKHGDFSDSLAFVYVLMK